MHAEEEMSFDFAQVGNVDGLTWLPTAVKESMVLGHLARYIQATNGVEGGAQTAIDLRPI